MRLKLERDIVFLDFEATGTDTTRDRIVQIAMIRLSPDGTRRTFDSLVDPDVSIPAEATAIHHITQDMVRSSPKFKDLALKILEFMLDADVGGFGIARYDLPLMACEFKRAGLAFDLAGRKVVDALLIFHRMEPRTLGAAMQFYCGRPIANAHDARADTEASLDVFIAQVERYQGQDGKPALPAELAGISDFCTLVDPKHVDTRGKFVWRHGSAAFNFGKYQTRALEEVVKQDRPYVQWLADGGGAGEVAEICARALRGEFPKRSA
ncbi:MAG: 3'-5' exonuclease [Elusimicrobia bacterium]|nr:3'-5' exonuclease [Elusimicrobiota bacterium]